MVLGGSKRTKNEKRLLKTINNKGDKMKFKTNDREIKIAREEVAMPFGKIIEIKQEEFQHKWKQLQQEINQLSFE